MGGDNRVEVGREESSRNMYKDHMNPGWEVGMGGIGGVIGEKWRQLYLNTIKNKIKIKLH